MSAKTSSPPENQQPLFGGLNFNPREHVHTPFVPWTEYGDAQNVAMVMALEKGPSVDIKKRDTALLATLGRTAHASKMIGLQRAVETPRRKNLEERYDSDLPAVVEGARTAGNQSEIDARSEFRTVFGYTPELAHFMGELAMSELFGGTYDKFQDIHFGAKGNRARNKLKNRIHKNQEITKNTEHVHRAVRKQMRKSSAV